MHRDDMNATEVAQDALSNAHCLGSGTNVTRPLGRIDQAEAGGVRQRLRILPRSLHRPVAVVDGSLSENCNKIGVQLGS